MPKINTRRAQRKLTNDQVHDLLYDYVHTSADQRQLAVKYGVHYITVSNIIRERVYKDIRGIDLLRYQAQQKAIKNKMGRGRRVNELFEPEPARTPIYIDLASFESVDGAILMLEPIRERLAGSAA
jgi:hypothetical protein